MDDIDSKQLLVAARKSETIRVAIRGIGRMTGPEFWDAACKGRLRICAAAGTISPMLANVQHSRKTNSATDQFVAAATAARDQLDSLNEHPGCLVEAWEQKLARRIEEQRSTNHGGK